MEDFAKTVFLTRTEAESALGRNKKGLPFRASLSGYI